MCVFLNAILTYRIMNEKSILLAGASGALGIELLKLLQNDDVYVRSLTRTKEGIKRLKVCLMMLGRQMRQKILN